MTKAGMPSPFTPGGVLQIPAVKAASRLDPPSGASLPTLPPPPSPEDHITSSESIPPPPETVVFEAETALPQLPGLTH